MLTRKQSELHTYIQNRLKESGVSPSFEEMKDALALKSKSGVHRLFSELEERGLIRRLPNRARALATYDEGDTFDQSAAKGFVHVHGLSSKISARRDLAGQ